MTVQQDHATGEKRMRHTVLRFALFTLTAGLAFAGSPQVIGVLPNVSADLRGVRLGTTADVIVQ